MPTPSLRPRRLSAALGAIASFALLLTGCSAAEAPVYTPPAQVEAKLPADMVDQMSTAVQEAMASSGSSGAIVGVWVPWAGTWVTGMGTQGAGSDAKVTPDMSFRIADVTRLMTCDVLYAMADEGAIQLDDAVTKHVSGVADLSEITLLDLCNGDSGLGSSQARALPMWLNTPGRDWQPLQLASYGMSGARTAPGTVFKDSDAGYILLGLALERVSGLTASELIDKYVTTPLGLASTVLPEPLAAAPGPEPALRGTYAPKVEGGYDCTATVDITTSSSSIGFTDAGVTSTIADLGRYAQAEARQVLRAKGATPGRWDDPLPVSETSPAWYQATGGGFLVGTMVGQHGWQPGYATSTYSDPETGLTVAVVLNNSSSGGSIPAYLVWELAAIASKAPAASGQTAPEFGLPFTAETYQQAIQKAAVCVAPPEEE